MSAGSNTIWVLADPSPFDENAEGILPTGPVGIDADRLGKHLQEFVAAFSKSLDNVKDISPTGFALSAVAVDVKLTAQFGFALVSQAGVQGGITLTFTRK